MQRIKTTSGIYLNYQDIGDKGAPVIVLIMGLGAQMTIWPDELINTLVENGFRVVRFDNRDVGLSSHLQQMGNPSLFKTWLSHYIPVRHKIPYQLDDMVEDVLELLAKLKIKKVHLVGASMGGMIAQIFTVKHKKKVLSLTSIMSSVSKPSLSRKNISVFLRLAKKPCPFNREAAIRYQMKMMRLIGSPLYPLDDETVRSFAVQNIDRGYNPDGFKRQLVAITASGDRSELLGKTKVSTLVIHGSEDPIIPVSKGVETAETIKKSKLKIIEGMGHDFPVALMPSMAKWITKHVNKAELRKEKKRLKRRLIKQEKLKSLL